MASLSDILQPEWAAACLCAGADRGLALYYVGIEDAMNIIDIHVPVLATRPSGAPFNGAQDNRISAGIREIPKVTVLPSSRKVRGKQACHESG